VEVLLCDADDCLFGSETHAFAASSDATNEFLAAHGVDRGFSAEELQRVAAGRNFRANATALAERFGFSVDPVALERWVTLERERVTSLLAERLRPEPDVVEPLMELSQRYRLAVVSSSALARLDVCFTASGLDDLFPRDLRFSAEDSLPSPTSKPDPAVYSFAGRALGVSGSDAVAIEDSVSGTRSAVAAGFRTIGNLLFVPPREREARATALREAGATALIASWRELT
jgi:beta-phosphoglucomutase-like phosphatase (HAD superfamily)